MDKQFSIYLDAIRISAAIAVFLTHLPGHMGGWLWQLSGLGHEAVILFFVMSGYVISYVTQEKETNVLEYAANRFARIYSVALPAILLTIFLFYLGNYIDSYPLDRRGINQQQISPIITTISAIFFLNQSWTQITIFSNLPYWSLGYEVLYYIFFGILMFVRGQKKYTFLLILAAIMGPNILLYLPIWMFGVWCQKFNSRFKISLDFSVVLFVFTMLMGGYLCLDSTQDAIDIIVNNFLASLDAQITNDNTDHLGSDYLLALAIMLNLIAVNRLSKSYWVFGESAEKFIRFMASYTFSLYLYHAPILFFVESTVPFERHPVGNILGCTIFTLGIIFLLGNVTEKKKNVYKRIFYKIIYLVRLRALAGPSRLS